jgi:hypothetical protein
MNASLTSFGDTYDSKQISIYLIGGTKTAVPYIERIKLRLRHGTWVIPLTWTHINVQTTNQNSMDFRFSEGLIPTIEEEK